MLTEIMVDPFLPDGDAEWFEFYNPSDEPISMDGCTVVDQSPVSVRETLDGYYLEPYQYIVFKRDLDPDCNGGIVSELQFTFSLNNGGDTLSVVCEEGPIFSVSYPFTDVEVTPGYSMSLDIESGRWCLGQREYTAETSGDPEVDNVCANQLPDPIPVQYGTPGSANDPCP